MQLAERGVERRTGLHDEEVAHGGGLRGDEALVLVAPQDEVEEIGQHTLVHVVLGRMRHAVLVKHQHAEPTDK